jgi:polyferredoxin
VAITLWRRTGTIFFLFDIGYIGTSLGVGTGLYALLPRHKKPLGRRLAQFLIGVYMVGKGWVPGPWKWMRYAHFALSLGLVAALVFVFGYRPQGRQPLWWLLAGNLLYYASAIPLAFALKDNRAFCKYLCPVPVLMKLGSRFALLKIAGEPERCNQCMACVKACPMDIRIPDYLMAGQRVLSTECILCQTCVSACPTNTLASSWGFDAGRRERLKIRPQAN